jgi:hypothetical protein
VVRDVFEDAPTALKVSLVAAGIWLIQFGIVQRVKATSSYGFQPEPRGIGPAILRSDRAFALLYPENLNGRTLQDIIDARDLPGLQTEFDRSLDNVESRTQHLPSLRDVLCWNPCSRTTSKKKT